MCFHHFSYKKIVQIIVYNLPIRNEMHCVLIVIDQLGIISEQKKSNFCWLSIDPSIPTPILLGKAEEEALAAPRGLKLER